jgi:hypothetical protein
VPIAIYTQGNSTYVGAEASFETRVLRTLWFNGKVDYTRAELTDHNKSLPRISPLRGTLGFNWSYKAFRVQPELILVNRQIRVFDRETPTAGYAVFNAGYDLLALIIEKASGETYPDYIRKHIAEPLGLKDTGYCTNTAIIKNRAAPYEVAKGTVVNADAWGNYGYGSAMLCSTVTELVKFQQALDEHRILSPASVSLMREGVRISDGPTIGYGFGTRLGDLDGHPMIGHSGDGGGWTSALAYYPTDRLTVVVLTNTENDNDPNYLHAESLQAMITRKALNLVPRPPTNMPLSISEAQKYVGDWGVPKAQIFLDGKILKVKPPGYPGEGLKLLYQGEHTFAIEGIQSDMRLKFVFDGAQANWFLFYDNGYFTWLAKR